MTPNDTVRKTPSFVNWSMPAMGVDALVHSVERRLAELGENAALHEKARAEMLIGDARQALKDEAPLERLRSLTSELQSVLQGLSAQGGSPPGNGHEAAPNGVDDDVIDAEFTPS